MRPLKQNYFPVHIQVQILQNLQTQLLQLVSQQIHHKNTLLKTVASVGTSFLCFIYY